MTIKNDRVIRALLCQEIDRTPIWLMRQAGRYLPEYRKIRAQAGDFLSLCKNPELACEVTLQPIRRFGFDAAILFSDILTIPDAMGLGLDFVEDEGPRFAKTMTDERVIAQLPIPDPERELRYVPDTVRAIKKALRNDIPLIGFSGSPWTVACYMVEGGGSKTFSGIKRMMYAQPMLLKQLLEKLVQATILYLNAQIAAGVDIIMLFDTWGGLLTPEAYQEFSLSYMQHILAGLTTHHEQKTIPTILFTKGGALSLAKMAASGCDAIGLDWTINIADAQRMVDGKVALQGNLDPSILYASPEIIQLEAEKILAQFPDKTGHVFNLGHGIYPDTPIENVEVLVKTVQNY